jgi:uncharacterized protein (DUF362 family)
MKNKMGRREFFEQGAKLGVSAAIAGSSILSKDAVVRASAAEDIGITVVTGQDYGKAATKAVELLGGMQEFVPKNTKVALLANVQRSFPGTFTKPEILQSVIRMCKESGAKEINCISLLPEKNWEETGLAEIIRTEKVNLKLFSSRDASRFTQVEVPKGRVLKNAEIMKEFFNNDLLINLPITKDHAGNKFTGTLKNLMGLNSSRSNRTFHKDDWTTNKDSIAFLDQCIADLNTIIEPALCVVDATEFITTNGPMGPGKLSKPQKVVAGIDRIAVDAYCTGLFGLKPTDIVMINRGYEHKLGEIDLSKVNVREVVT